MYYLHTTGKRAYTVGNMTIPAIATGGKKQEWLQLGEAEYRKLRDIKIIAGLIDRGEIAVYDKVPNEAIMSAHVANQELAALKERVTRLTDENVMLRKDLDSANAAIKNGSNGNARALKELQAKYDALQKEALEEIESLKKQLASKG